MLSFIKWLDVLYRFELVVCAGNERLACANTLKKVGRPGDVGIEKSAWGGTARRNRECQTLELFSPKALKETQGGFLK
jgi:hypothetical protein